jgi:hypothetical protein
VTLETLKCQKIVLKYVTVKKMRPGLSLLISQAVLGISKARTWSAVEELGVL